MHHKTPGKLAERGRFGLLVLCLALGAALTADGLPEAPGSEPAQVPSLETVLSQMDAAAATFQSAQADFAWDQYQRVVDETDVQKGKLYFRRAGKEIQMAADISEPDKKYMLFANGKLSVYQPRIDQVTEYDAGKDRETVQTVLVLGFGGRGHDLAKSFTVKLAGVETVDGVRTVKLELVPKSAKARSLFDHVVLWVDPVRGVSLRQQAWEASGDYRLAHYANIRINEKIPDDVFQLKTTSKTKVLRPQG
ncbi:MAG TPA: outer membrane lipoprotein carrier protein LolA [Terriglobales bacterium]|nr:outer membrane lipoprotein carrier protein LolA [Terriglobales bacterium]